MTLAETFDTHIKAISTAEEWGTYRKMVAREDDMDYFKKVLTYNARQIAKTFGVPEHLTQNNKAMKYRVKTNHLENVDYGDEITPSPKQSDTYDHLITKEIIERNPDWFEPVEQVTEGQYWKWDGENEYMFRIQEVYLETKRCDILYPRTGAETQWYINGITEDARKLSTHDIEQALKKECHNRYKKGQRIETVCGHEKDVSFQDLKYLKEGDSLVAYSGLQQGYITFYQQGNWAEAVDQTPHIEINGKIIEVEDGTVKISCGDTIEEETFKCFYEVVDKYDLEVSRNGEDINEQLRQIWDEMPQKLAGKPVEFSIEVSGDDIFKSNSCGMMKL